MKKSAKTEIVIAAWAGRTGPAYWGDQDYCGYDNQSSAFWVSLRGAQPGDRQLYLNNDCRAVGDIGLYVYVTVDGTVSIDMRLHDMGSMTLHEAEQRIKALKRLLAKGKSRIVRTPRIRQAMALPLDQRHKANAKGNGATLWTRVCRALPGYRGAAPRLARWAARWR